MSLPFFKRKKDAKDFWGERVVKVYVPKSRGFIQARVSGNYYVTPKMKQGLKLNSVSRGKRIIRKSKGFLGLGLGGL